MHKIGIFGTSGFAREVADIAYELGYEPFFIAKDEAELEAWEFTEKVILESEINKTPDSKYVIGIGENAIRESLMNRYKDLLVFVNLIHPSATFGRGQRDIIESGQGIIVCAGARFTSNILVGDHTIFNLNVTIGHDVIIESFVNIAPGAHISGNILIKHHCWIGTGAAINQGTNEKKLIIGSGTIIGSGSVVINDCDDQAVYVGAPAKRIK